ncbi:MAG: hypothetical protein MUC97_12575 [Bernardetiaceae bacterium]|jgi:hypothetical protein|nr:hypothetical protein [Bernardetiaceae bacterium]
MQALSDSATITQPNKKISRPANAQRLTQRCLNLPLINVFDALARVYWFALLVSITMQN